MNDPHYYPSTRCCTALAPHLLILIENFDGIILRLKPNPTQHHLHPPYRLTSDTLSTPSQPADPFGHCLLVSAPPIVSGVHCPMNFFLRTRVNASKLFGDRTKVCSPCGRNYRKRNRFKVCRVCVSVCFFFVDNDDVATFFISTVYVVQGGVVFSIEVPLLPAPWGTRRYTPASSHPTT